MPRKDIDIDTIYSIYIITNTINDLVYIGMTKNPIKVRFQTHCKKSSECRLIRDAIQELGKERFHIEALANSKSYSDADFLERSFISLYDSTRREKGYNLSDGGSYAHWSEESKQKLSASTKGKPHPNQRIPAEKERGIIAAHLAGKPYDDIAKKFDVCISAISAVANRNDLPRRKFQPISEDVEKKVVDMYLSGLSYKEITTSLFVGISSIIKIVAKNNLPRQTEVKRGQRKQLIQSKRELVVRDYTDGKLVADIATTHGVRVDEITDIVKGAGIHLRKLEDTQFKKGDRSRRLKITKRVAEQIRAEHKTSNSSYAALGIKYGVSRTTISRVLSSTHRYQFDK